MAASPPNKESTVNQGTDDDQDELHVRLKERLQLSDLDKDGATFEIDPERFDPGPEDDGYFGQLQSGQYLSPTAETLEAQGIVAGSGSETGSDVDLELPWDIQRRKMLDISPDKDGGVLKKVIHGGSGPLVTDKAKCTFHLQGYLELADEPFDSSRLRKEEYRKTLDQLIPGLAIGLRSMRQGELSLFLVSYRYGFGELGSPPRVPAKADLMLEVELLSFVEYDGVDAFFEKPMSERKRASFEEIFRVAKAKKQEGTEFFKKQNYHKAMKMYEKAIKVLENASLANQDEEDDYNKCLLRLYLNMAVVNLIHLKQYPRCLHYCKEALYIDSQNAKALYLKGKAHHKLGDFDRAHDTLKHAKKLKPYDKDINAELAALGKSIQQFEILERKTYQRMFSKESDLFKMRKVNDAKNIEEKDPQKFVTEEFKEVIRHSLEDFKKDNDVDEIPFPSGRLTIGETAYLANCAKEMGFDCRTRGKDNNLVVKVVKPK